MPKSRSIILGYILVAISGGIFAFIWAYLMMRDVNQLTGDRKIPAAPISMVMAVGYIGAAACLVLDDPAILSPAFLFWVEAVGNLLLWVTFGSFALSSVLVYRGILRLTGKPFGFWPGAFAALGSLLGFIFLPYAQYLLNRVEKRPAA